MAISLETGRPQAKQGLEKKNKKTTQSQCKVFNISSLSASIQTEGMSQATNSLCTYKTGPNGAKPHAWEHSWTVSHHRGDIWLKS